MSSKSCQPTTRVRYPTPGTGEPQALPGSALAVIVPGNSLLCPSGSCWHLEWRCPLLKQPLCARVSQTRSCTDREGWSLLTNTVTRVLAQSVSSAPCLHSHRNKLWVVPWQQQGDVNSWCATSSPKLSRMNPQPPRSHSAGQQLIWGSALEQTGHKDQWVHLPVPS